MARESSSSRSSSSKSPSSSNVDDKLLLKFYQKKFEENQRKEDKYRERVDRHLKNLVSDRHELEEEVLRRGEKISDLQKALVELQLSIFQERERYLKLSAENEELKRNEEELHGQMRQLLSMTQQKDVRDKIIYILKDPKVEIGYQSGISSRNLRSHESDLPANKKLKGELEHLQTQLDELLKVSKTKSDVVLEDCKESLERCRIKIMQDEIQIRELQKKLRESNVRKREKGQQFSPTTAEKITATSTSLFPETKFFTRRSDSQVSTIPKEHAATSYSRTSTIPKKHVGTSYSQAVASSQKDAATSVTSLLQSESFFPQSDSWTILQSESSRTISQSESFKSVSSNLKDIHLSLILLLKVVSKINSILNSMQATKVYQRIASIPRAPIAMQEYVEGSSIIQLETYFRQCTRLTFDINNMHKGLTKYVYKNKKKIQNPNALEAELRHLQELLKELTVTTAETDLLNIGLKRSDFFPVLKGMSSLDDDEEQNLDDFQKIISNCDALAKTTSKAVDFVEGVIATYRSISDLNIVTQESQFGAPSTSLEYQRDSFKGIPRKVVSDPLPRRQDKLPDSSKDLENLLGIYQRTVEEAESLGLGLSVETKLLSEKLKATQKKIQEEEEKLKKCDDYYKDDIMQEEIFLHDPKPPDTDDIIRKINKTLSKVKRMEQGEYFKDDQLCKQLVENVNELTKRFQQLTEEFNMKYMQDQFSEYSKLTLSKLEELAKQSKNSVVAAEAQIAAHRSNAKHLSQKLKETEELLRESINECLTLKQKVKQAEELRERDKYTFISGLREKISSHDEMEDVLNDLIQTVSDDKGSKETARPFVCVYCQQGMGHKLCEEKIRDLRADERKSKTMLKLFQQEMKEEKATLKHYREIAERTSAELTGQNNSLKEALQSQEKKNASLLEQLKVEKNRVKNMERFRRLEIEGFQTDIRNLKSKIRDMEKQLLKAVLIFENNNKDMELLKTVHETAQRSKEATAAIRRLKAKLYELENDIKNL